MQSVDEGYDCCRRFYYYGQHSYKCQQVNGEAIKSEEQKQNEIPKIKPNEKDNG